MREIFSDIDILIAPVLAKPVRQLDVGDGPRKMEAVLSFPRLSSGVNVPGLPELPQDENVTFAQHENVPCRSGL